MDDDPDTPRRRVIKHAGNLDPDAAIKHFVASGGDGAGIRVDHKVDVTPAELKRELRETARGSAKALAEATAWLAKNSHKLKETTPQPEPSSEEIRLAKLVHRFKPPPKKLGRPKKFRSTLIPMNR